MRTKIIFFITCNLIICNLQFSQNITNTLGTNGEFVIKSNLLTYFRVSMTTGSIMFQSNNGNSQRGFLFIGPDRFLHTYFQNGNIGSNTFLGINSGNFTLGGSINFEQGSYNTAVGHSSLNSLTTGYRNSSFGLNSLFSNTTGNENSAFGVNSLLNNTIGVENSAFGSSSLRENVTGNFNSAFGLGALNQNTSGSRNSAFGYLSLQLNTGGVNNSAFGGSSLWLNTLGKSNTAVGYYSLRNSTGNFNTAIGDSSGINISSGSNNIAIGYNSQVPTGTSSNQIRLGNTSITHAGIQVAWTVTSDRNLKSNIYNTNLGLGFIAKLRPVSYTRKNDESNKTEYGLIAQEVEEVLQLEGIENTGMLTITDEGEYQLRYNDLIAPMIKAIQELKTENEKKDYKIAELENQLNSIIQVVDVLKQNQSSIKEIKLGEK